MDTGNIMENQLQDQYDGWENEQIEAAKKRQRAIADRIVARIKKTNSKRGWDVFAEKVVKYNRIEKDGAVMRADGMCVGNIEAGDFLEDVPEN